MPSLTPAPDTGPAAQAVAPHPSLPLPQTRNAGPAAPDAGPAARAVAPHLNLNGDVPNASANNAPANNVNENASPAAAQGPPGAVAPHLNLIGAAPNATANNVNEIASPTAAQGPPVVGPACGVPRYATRNRWPGEAGVLHPRMIPYLIPIFKGMMPLIMPHMEFGPPFQSILMISFSATPLMKLR